MSTQMTPKVCLSTPSVVAFNATSQADLTQSVSKATNIAKDVLGLPFDIARAQYAHAVQVGLIERSMLASRDFSRVLSSLEQMTLGPWARHI